MAELDHPNNNGELSFWTKDTFCGGIVVKENRGDGAIMYFVPPDHWIGNVGLFGSLTTTSYANVYVQHHAIAHSRTCDDIISGMLDGGVKVSTYDDENCH